jgi:hypothetical protein
LTYIKKNESPSRCSVRVWREVRKSNGGSVDRASQPRPSGARGVARESTRQSAEPQGVARTHSAQHASTHARPGATHPKSRKNKEGGESRPPSGRPRPPQAPGPSAHPGLAPGCRPAWCRPPVPPPRSRLRTASAAPVCGAQPPGPGGGPGPDEAPRGARCGQGVCRASRTACRPALPLLGLP